MASGDEAEGHPASGLDAFAWLFGAAELLAPSVPAPVEEAASEAPPRAA